RDALAIEKAFQVLEALEPEASFEDRLRFHYFRGSSHWLDGDLALAAREFERVLDPPHFDLPGLVFLHQHAALNLGVIEEHRGDFPAARRALRRAKRLIEEWPVRRMAGLEVDLRLAILGLLLGDGEDPLADIPTSGLADHTLGLECLLEQEGTYRMLLGQLDEAARCFERALGCLAMTGHDVPYVEGSVLGHLAVLERDRGQVDKARALHARALRSVRGNARDEAEISLEWAITLLAAGEPLAALDQLRGLPERLHRLPNPYLASAALQAQAVAQYRLGQLAEVDPSLEAACRLLRQGDYDHTLVRSPEIAPDLWRLLARLGEHELLASAQRRFPEQAARIRCQLEA
ncbi:MAG: hypothetical protein KGR26_16560, partial [Cyanobacteria bacterium REEB65]|nr:hypothetical protein [Cyanobacteria bacterium REEB65]